MPFYLVLLLLSVSMVSPIVYRFLNKYAGWILSLAPFSIFIWTLAQARSIFSGEFLAGSWNWVPSLNLDVSYYFDGLSLLFFLLISGIGGLVLIYGGAYLKGNEQLGRFYSIILLFMAAMLGLVASDHLVIMFIFWEVTSISSYLLIGFKHENEEARKSALRALVITGSGGLALLGGIVLLGQVAGTFKFSELLLKTDIIIHSSLAIPILVLVLIGAFTKSAQFPFHFWLPGAMAAPTPVSSYLHSATMVKAGFFLLARLMPVLGDIAAWQNIIMLFGTVTMLFGALMAVAQTDLKKLLAYSTISALGLLFLLLGINTQLSVKAAMLFLIIHSLYKGSLFMVAGIIDHSTGTRDVLSLNGLYRFMPIVAISAGVAAFSMSGLPPLLGFIGKELIYEAKVQAPAIYQWVLPLTILASALNVAIALVVGVRPFLGNLDHTSAIKHNVSAGFWIGPFILALPSLFLGAFPSLVSPFSNAAASAVRAEQIAVKLALWHGLNPVLLMSFGTVLLGIGIYLVRERLRNFKKEVDKSTVWGPKRIYEKGFNLLLEFAKKHTDWVQNGSLRVYIAVIMSTVVVATGYTLGKINGWDLLSTNFSHAKLYEWAVALTILVAAMVIVFTPSRIISAVASGVIGYSIALIFVLYSAPDLAITQILVETLTVILFVSVVYFLPLYKSNLKAINKWFNALLATVFGILMTVLTLKATQVQIEESISSFFVENSLTAAYGRNIVNVILVDFRALDTLGELTVLGISAIGIVALLRWHRFEKGER